MPHWINSLAPGEASDELIAHVQDYLEQDSKALSDAMQALDEARAAGDGLLEQGAASEIEGLKASTLAMQRWLLAAQAAKARRPTSTGREPDID